MVSDATNWDTGTNIDSLYQVDLGGPFSTQCDSTSIQGAMTATSGNIYLISRGYKGEIRVADDVIKYALPTTIRDQFTAAPGILGVTKHTYARYIIDASAGSYGTTSDGITYTSNKYREIEGEIDECTIYEDGLTLDAANNPFFDEFKKESAFSYDQRSQSGSDFAGHGSHCTSVFTPMTSKPMWIKIDLVEQDYSFNE